MITKNKKLMILISVAVISVIAMTAVFMLFAKPVNAGYGTIGTMNYDGSINHCHYDIVAGANLAEDHRFHIQGFYVQAQGVSCERNIFTTFTYDVTFYLKKSGVVIKTYDLYIRITAAKQLKESKNNPIIFIENDLKGKGDYTIEWSGSIKSNVTIDVNGSYNVAII